MKAMRSSIAVLAICLASFTAAAATSLPGGISFYDPVTNWQSIARELPFQNDFGQDNPRMAMENLRSALERGDYARATNYLNFNLVRVGTSAADKVRLARMLQVVLDHQAWLPQAEISSLPAGNTNDDLPPELERIGRLEAGTASADLVLVRLPCADGVQLWKLASPTVAAIPKLYQHLDYKVLDALLPERVMDALLARKFMGVPLATVIKLFSTFVVGGVLLWGLSRLILLLLHRIRPGFFYHFVRQIYPPVILLLLVTVIRNYYRNAVLSDSELKIYNAATLPIIAAIWLISRLVDFASDRGRYELTKRGQASSVPLVNLSRRVIKVVLVILGITLWLENQGFKVTTILAGLGVAGIAVGLAGQKLIEDLFGAITLYGTRRVKRDDFIRFGDRLGIVEDIGLRVTTIRSLDRTLVSLPNGAFAQMEIENFAERDRIWFHPRIGLRYETTPDQLRYILVAIRKLLYAHPKVLNDGARVRFTNFGAYSLDLDIFCYVAETNYSGYLGVAEDLNLRIMDIVNQAGSGFAFPSQTTYFERGQGLDPALARQSAAEVEKWKAEQKLYLPDFPEDKIRELEGTIEYPPAGSPDGKPPGAR